MNENLKISDLVVILNQTAFVPERVIPGGRVVMMWDAMVLVQRSNGALITYKREDLRKLNSEDMKEPGMELY